MATDFSSTMRLEQEQRFREDLMNAIKSLQEKVDALQKTVNELTAPQKAKLLKE